MGLHASKGEVVADEAAAKTNGQENGHVKTNGDVSAKPDGEAAAGDAIEPAAEVEAPSSTESTKKKKRFSLKSSFNFKGISLKKNKKSKEESQENGPVAEEKEGDGGEEKGAEVVADEATPTSVQEAATPTDGAEVAAEDKATPTAPPSEAKEE